MPADFLSRTVTTKDEKAADLEDDSDLAFTLGSNSGIFRAHCVKVHVRYLIY